LNGNRISSKEDKLLIGGSIILKNQYAQVEFVQKLLGDHNRLEDGKFNSDNIGFQIYGNTILHLYSLDAGKLQIILNYMIEHRRDYLNAILIK